MARHKSTQPAIDPQPTCYDKIGNVLEPGMIIAYGHALDRSAGLRIGKVIDIRAYASTRYDHVKNAAGGWDRLTVPSVDWRITVQGVDDHWGGQKTLCRLGTLQYPDRIIVLGKSTECIPDKGAAYVDVLAGV